MAQPRSWLEHSLVTPIAESMYELENCERVLTYGEVVQLRFVECGMMLGVELEYEGLVFASYVTPVGPTCMHNCARREPATLRTTCDT